MRKRLIIPGVTVLVILFLNSIFFTVSEIELAVLTHFGDVKKTLESPGLYLKLPEPVENVIKIEKRLQVLDTVPAEYLTQDKKNILVDCYICWRVQNAETFIKSVTDAANAEIRLKDITSSELGAVLGKNPLSALISTDQEEMNLDFLMSTVTERCAAVASKDFGIEVVEIKMKWLNLPEQNKFSVYDRMKAERARMAKKYRAEGEAEATKIRAEADKERREILAEAYREAEKIMGEGDAQAMKIYAEAYSMDPEFYRYSRTLDSYRKFLNEKTTIILSSESELLGLLEGAAGK